MGISLPKCQFLGNRAGTRAITTSCQLNANEQAPASALTRTQYIYMGIINTSVWIEQVLQCLALKICPFFLPVLRLPMLLCMQTHLFLLM